MGSSYPKASAGREQELDWGVPGNAGAPAFGETRPTRAAQPASVSQNQSIRPSADTLMQPSNFGRVGGSDAATLMQPVASEVSDQAQSGDSGTFRKYTPHSPYSNVPR